jgi:hypothetical protein
MRLATVLLVAGVALAAYGVTSPAPWIGTFVGVALAVAGYVRLEDTRAARREARRRARRPGYIDRQEP